MRALYCPFSRKDTPIFSGTQNSWKFITPRAAWWGGWRERMVATTKRFLQKVLGRSQVDAEVLYAVLVWIDIALNSRQITQDEVNETLTPAHFLAGGKLTTIPHGPEPVRTRSLTRPFQQHQRLTETLWRRWQRSIFSN